MLTQCESLLSPAQSVTLRTAAVAPRPGSVLRRHSDLKLTPLGVVYSPNDPPQAGAELASNGVVPVQKQSRHIRALRHGRQT